MRQNATNRAAAKASQQAQAQQQAAYGNYEKAYATCLSGRGIRSNRPLALGARIGGLLAAGGWGTPIGVSLIGPQHVQRVVTSRGVCWDQHRARRRDRAKRFIA